ncbi:hypothetical protein OE88DRAFT_761749 [Heliocybe sulcata]|uniref:Uncharacterized protein n=1 Tax=Heliocybe sulcata TaxID=5364 RepID=A0A5C3MQ21_9AGAM|nr:hypothetical protein OE88DRAFT_761749 [Heliocybe sulcata]
MAQAALLNLRGSEMKSRGAGLGTDVLSPMAVQTPVNQLMAAQNLSQHPMTAQYQQQRDMQLLLDSLKNGGMGLGGGLGHRAGNLLPGSVDVNTLLAAQELNNWNGLGSAQAGPGGFTAAEQLLLQAHAQAKARLGASPTLPLAGLPQAALNRGLGRGHLDFAGGVASPNLRNYAQLGSPVLDVLSGLPEQELHGVPAALSQRLQSQGQGRLQNHRGAERGYGALRSSVDLDLDSIRFGQVAGERRGSTTNDPLVAQRQVSQGRPQPSSLHMRATTLPASYVGNHRSGGALDAAGKASLNSGPGTRGNNLKIDHAASNANSGGDKDQSPAVSPALTYASRTPSSTSFSPATPYFNAGFEGYENVGVSVGGGDQSPAGLGLSMMNAVAGNVGGKGKGRAVN